jgi:hypothetical protein
MTDKSSNIIVNFIADKVKIRTNWKIDNSATVEFTVGEYMVPNLKGLVGIVDKELKIKVEIIE